VLLIAAGLLMRSFARLRAIDPGFDPHHLFSLTISVAGRPEYVGAARENLYDGILRQVESAPGVMQASMINHLPIGGDVWSLWRPVEGRPIPGRGSERSAVCRVVRPNYFATMRIALISGRDFNRQDTENSPPVVIINQTLAGREFPRETLLGKRISLGD